MKSEVVFDSATAFRDSKIEDDASNIYISSPVTNPVHNDWKFQCNHYVVMGKNNAQKQNEK